MLAIKSLDIDQECNKNAKFLFTVTLDYEQSTLIGPQRKSTKVQPIAKGTSPPP